MKKKKSCNRALCKLFIMMFVLLAFLAVMAAHEATVNMNGEYMIANQDGAFSTNYGERLGIEYMDVYSVFSLSHN